MTCPAFSTLRSGPSFSWFCIRPILHFQSPHDDDIDKVHEMMVKE